MPVKKYSQRSIDRVNLLVRLELANPSLSLQEVAQLAGLKLTRFSIIRGTPLYLQIKNRYLTGLLANLDNKVSNQYQASKETLSFAVPIALQSLVQQVLSSTDERVKNKAANDILDREGTFAKVRRLSVSSTGIEKAAGDDKDKEVAGELLKALAKAPDPNISDLDPPTDIIQ